MANPPKNAQFINVRRVDKLIKTKTGDKLNVSQN